MPRYVALVRGVNSGKNPAVKMEVLRQAFEDLGLERVKSVLASGNILFETDSTDEQALEQQIEAVLPGTIGFESAVIVRTMAGIQRLIESDPFQDTPITPRTRPYATFLKQAPQESPQFPVIGEGYTILGIVEGVVCSVVDLAAAKTPDLMRVLDREFGPGVTTRSWNTVERIARTGE